MLDLSVIWNGEIIEGWGAVEGTNQQPLWTTQMNAAKEECPHFQPLEGGIFIPAECEWMATWGAVSCRECGRSVCKPDFLKLSTGDESTAFQKILNDMELPRASRKNQQSNDVPLSDHGLLATLAHRLGYSDMADLIRREGPQCEKDSTFTNMGKLGASPFTLGDAAIKNEWDQLLGTPANKPKRRRG